MVGPHPDLRPLRVAGIRKTLGASVPNLVTLLSRELLILILIADLIAFPVVFWVMDEWLTAFVYRIELGVWVFLLSGLLTVVSQR